jgi:hypothetical protein
LIDMPQPPPPLPAQNGFARVAAIFSLIASLLTFAINLLVLPATRQSTGAMMMWGTGQGVLTLAGLVLGITGWALSTRSAARGIMGIAIAGTILNALVLLSVVIAIPKIIAANHRVRFEPTSGKTLAEARRSHVTHLLKKRTSGLVPDYPPPKLFLRTRYKADPGEMAAYVTPDPGDGKRHPAIIWLVGGFDSSISEIAWTPQPVNNDQSASAFWKAGVITMYPSLRGGNVNPGVKEGFYGEVDDVRAAARFLQSQSYVDPERIYLGGHSTGGTLALLVAEMRADFRAVFAFGPVSDIRGYGAQNLPFDIHDSKEADLRSPLLWLDNVHSPTFVFEGAEGRSNVGELHRLERATKNPALHFYAVNGYNHFGILAPVTKLLATKILQDAGPSPAITFSARELQSK